MMNTRLGLYFDRCLAALKNGLAISLLFATFFSGPSAQAKEEEMAGNPDGLVEVHIKADPYAPYVDRRTDWSWRFNAQWENFYPNNYISPATKGNYASVFGANQGSLISVNLGGQYNSAIGALYLDGLYGMGTIAGIVNGNTLTLSKYGAMAGILFDRLSPNPWVSPFVALEAINFNWAETATNVAGTTAITTGVLAGFSIHLNRVDAVAASEVYENYGVKNTFIDVYAVEYNTSNSASDPDFQTSPSLGAGFHLEF